MTAAEATARYKNALDIRRAKELAALPGIIEPIYEQIRAAASAEKTFIDVPADLITGAVMWKLEQDGFMVVGRYKYAEGLFSGATVIEISWPER